MYFRSCGYLNYGVQKLEKKDRLLAPHCGRYSRISGR